MPTELTQLELMEVSLVDMGDDPLAKVALFKRKEDSMEEEKEIQITEKEAKKKPMDHADMETPEEDAAEAPADEMAGDQKKPTKKSYKAEAEMLKALNEELEAKISVLEKALEEAKAPVEKKEEMVEIEGEMIAKSAIPAPVLKQLEELKKAKEAEELRKRADEILPNFKGTADQRAKLLKSVGGDNDLIEMLKAADELFSGLYKEIGKVDPENDMKSSTEKLNDMVKAYQEEHNTTFHKAYAAVIKTKEGMALVTKSYKE